MVGRLLYRKYGSFADEQSGELISYSKIVVAGLTIDSTSYKGNFKHGILESEYNVDESLITPEILDDLYGKVVEIDFDQVIGKKKPMAVKIRLAEGGETNEEGK